MKSLIVVIVLAFSGCSLFGPDSAPSTTTEDGRATWEAAGIDDYLLLQRSTCYCFGPHQARLTVRDGVLVGAVDLETGRALTVNEQRRFATIDEIFERIDVEGAVVTALYDARYGYPVEVNADPVRGMADDEFGYENLNFTPLRD